MREAWQHTGRLDAGEGAESLTLIGRKRVTLGLACASETSNPTHSDSSSDTATPQSGHSLVSKHLSLWVYRDHSYSVHYSFLLSQSGICFMVTLSKYLWQATICSASHFGLLWSICGLFGPLDCAAFLSRSCCACLLLLLVFDVFSLDLSIERFLNLFSPSVSPNQNSAHSRLKIWLVFSPPAVSWRVTSFTWRMSLILFITLLIIVFFYLFGLHISKCAWSACTSVCTLGGKHTHTHTLPSIIVATMLFLISYSRFAWIWSLLAAYSTFKDMPVRHFLNGLENLFKRTHAIRGKPSLLLWTYCWLVFTCHLLGLKKC